jgi:hypothetical protein
MRRSTLALLFLLAGCGAGPDPANAPRALPPTALEPPPVYSLLGFRQEIGLTSEQVTALDSIAEAVRQENAPLVQVLRERNPVRAQQRGFIVVDSVSQPALVQLRENNRRAVAAVGEILTPEQRTAACRVLDQSQRDRMARRGSSQQSTRARQGREPGRMEPGDTAWVRGAGGWAWCTPGAPATPAQPTPHVETPPDTLTDG